MQKKWYAVSVALLLLTACAPAESAVSETTPAETPATTAAPSATPEQAGTRWQERVSFDDSYTASLRDGSAIPQATLPLYYKGRWWGKTWATLAEETGLAEADLRALNPQITEAEDGALQADTSELLLSESYAIPQTQEVLATVAVPSMPEPYQERHYPLPAALPREAAEVLALSYSYKNHKLCLWANIARALIRKKEPPFAKIEAGNANRTTAKGGSSKWTKKAYHTPAGIANTI